MAAWSALATRSRSPRARRSAAGQAGCNDTWEEGQPETGNLTPPEPGLIDPKRGFGKVWREHPDIREAIGWAWEHEVAGGGVQLFEHGTMVLMQGKNWVYTFGAEQTHIGSMPPRP
jgi:hypothetical protein